MYRESLIGRITLIAGIVFIALSLRSPLAAVGPLANAIQQSTALSHGAVGMITTLPLLCFGFLSMLTPLFTRRWGIEGALGMSLGLITIGIAVRSLVPVAALFGGTLLLGVGIALGNVLLPSLVKRDFPHRKGWMTSLYSSLMGLGAAIAAGVSVPIAEDLGLGWRYALGIWAVIAVIGIIFWIPQLKHHTRPDRSVRIRKSLKTLGRSRLAWEISLFMGLQSFLFYVVLAWLPEILISQGMNPNEAGWMLSLSQAFGVLGTIILPVYAEKRPDQRGIVWGVCLMELVSIAGFLIPGTTFVPLWAVLIGFSLGCSFGLALLFMVMRTWDSETTTGLSGMSQSVGYLVAAAGPALFGALHDWFDSWSPPLILLLVVAALQLLFGLGAGQDKTISAGSGGEDSQ
ncbi:CynX/NimT family MFS transporter [Gracilimonas mengyeensis]|uniref:MFS transporter, CP family, cyanate transporter n=1 Tax=Gracilimonas mengyeensis TaxID=1302730 RepID=A0A521B0W1_9BACT|nr:MFS transporter [Gracilimonas mengyeensis]SMO40631.1 MFS transporter, CP family, cyanate transporter [Gracilimonas mengyeensis]